MSDPGWEERRRQEIRLKAKPIRKVLDELDEVRRQQEIDAMWRECEDQDWIADSLATYEAVKRRVRLDELRSEIASLTTEDQVPSEDET